MKNFFSNSHPNSSFSTGTTESPYPAIGISKGLRMHSFHSTNHRTNKTMELKLDHLSAHRLLHWKPCTKT